MFGKLTSKFRRATDTVKTMKDEDDDAKLPPPPSPAKKRKRDSIAESESGMTAPTASTKASSNTPKKGTARPTKVSRSKKQKTITVEELAKNEDMPFSIEYRPTKGSKEELKMGKSLLHGAKLDVAYQVQPKALWDELKGYKRYRVSDDTFELGDVVLVSPSDNPPEKDDSDVGLGQWWIAQILEIRAACAQRVFLRVFWIMRPKDTKRRRQPFQGRNELIPSNEMDVIEVLAVERTIRLRHWNEDDDDDKPDDEQADAFWRQTYNFHTGEYSSLRKICICDEPFYPDETNVRCNNEGCKTWMHKHCILHQAVEQAQARAVAGEDPFEEGELESVAATNGDVDSTTAHKLSSKPKKKKGGRKSLAATNFKAQLVAISEPRATTVETNGAILDNLVLTEGNESATPRFDSEEAAATVAAAAGTVDSEDTRHEVELTDLRPEARTAKNAPTKRFPLRCLKCRKIVEAD